MNRRPSLILSFLLVVVAGLLFTGVAAAGDKDGISQFKRRATIQIPGNKLEFFDISFVDATAQRYVLADRSNASIDIIDTHTNELLHQIGGFAGQKFNPDGTNDNAHSGPDGS